MESTEKALIISGILAGLNEWLKASWLLDKKWALPINLIGGVALAWAMADQYENFIVIGLAAGLAASGVYDNVKALVTFDNKKKK